MCDQKNNELEQELSEIPAEPANEDKVEPTKEDKNKTCSLGVRLKSKAVWVSVLGALGLIFNSLGLFAKWGIQAEEWNVIINSVCGILVTFGILNNPTDCRHF